MFGGPGYGNKHNDVSDSSIELYIEVNTVVEPPLWTHLFECFWPEKWWTQWNLMQHVNKQIVWL